MSKDMLGSVVRAAVGVPQERLDTLAKIASKMSSDNPDGATWHERFAQALADGLEKAVQTISTLFEFVASVNVPAVESFVARDKFREGETVDGVQLAWLGDNFKEHFLAKKEANIATTTLLRVHRLREASLDAPILSELGETAETFLAQFWKLLKVQGTGEKGTLLVNGYSNICYIRDDEDVLWAVSADWNSGRGWHVDAYSVEYPDRWPVDYQVVSR